MGRTGTEWERKVHLALAYMERHGGDTQEARSAAADCGDLIDTYQWNEAGRIWRQRQRRASTGRTTE